ncbi:hypothetical protein GPECTOR_7g1150 [Gonium pectorale]|uniref:Uncharacterized protein n=1 Tax=Gonium pectorale TaxID=33097 RepID=A0A150GTQ3_GONPE|nr:hypothetical protein GPECTOR_7g1150 [Gonium pectorale]|eukprot:KXZ53256.1 hypothetical protein GPECTOR_7g1150 [Gonium pectorale]
MGSVQDFNRLDLEGSLARAVCLMEWPERLPTLPSNCLSVHIEVVDAPEDIPGMPFPPSPHPARPQVLARGRAFAVEGSYDSDSESMPTYSCLPEEVETEAESDDYTDRRPRLVTLTPHGSYWEGRARRIISYIAAHSHACDGLVVLGEEQPNGASTYGQGNESDGSG